MRCDPCHRVQVPECSPTSIQIGIATEMEGRKLDFQVGTMSSTKTDEKEIPGMI